MKIFTFNERTGNLDVADIGKAPQPVALSAPARKMKDKWATVIGENKKALESIQDSKMRESFLKGIFPFV